MRPRHRVTRTAIELIKRFEGYRRKAAQLPDGRWTIGHGHTLTARGGAEVSEEDAEALLVYDLIGISHAVNEHVYAPLTQNQFDALCSFAFNLGVDQFRRSQVLKRLNEGQMVQAACAMELWRKAEFEGERIVLDALVRRRAAEKALFLTPPNDAWVPAPSPILRPLVDTDARDLIPSRRPAEVVTSMDGEAVAVARDAEPEPPAPPAVEDERPGSSIRAAAEAVAARLQALYPEPGEEPTAEEPADQAEAPEVPDEARPQADFAPPITAAAEPETPATEPEAGAETEAAAGSFDLPPPPADEPAADAAGEAPKGVIHDGGVFDFIPARVQPLPREPEPSIIWDILLAFLGIAFFSFAVVWAYAARPDAGGGFAQPWLVALLAGLAGVGFLIVAVYRLLNRLGRAAERD